MTDTNETKMRQYVVTATDKLDPEVVDAKSRDDAAEDAFNSPDFDGCDSVFVRAVAKSGQLYNRRFKAVRAKDAAE